MKRRVLVLRIGDHWFLRHVRDLYETLASRHASPDQPRGIMSIFPQTSPSPFWFRKKQVEGDLAYYLKDKESQKAFNQKLEKDAELKIYLAGHCSAGGSKLVSLETNETLYFELRVQAIAVTLHKIFTAIDVKSSAINPIKISLICCEAASGTNFGSKKDAFATRLLEQLHLLGCQHILVKAREQNVSAPIWGKKYTSGKKEHFYLDGNHKIYHIEKDRDLSNHALKLIKQCHGKTKVTVKREYLWSCLQQIANMRYIEDQHQIELLKSIITQAAGDKRIAEYRYGTAWFMKVCGVKSDSLKAFEQLTKQLANYSSTYETIVENGAPSLKML